MVDVFVFEFELLGPQEGEEVAVSVGNAVGELELIVEVLGGELEGQSVGGLVGLELNLLIGFGGFFGVFDLLFNLTPADALLFFVNFGLHVGFHASGVEALGLLEVADVELVGGRLKIFYFEVEPMEMAPRVAVHPHEQIVLVLAYLLLTHIYLENAV